MYFVAQCMDELVSEAPFMYQTELDTVTSYCFRALDGSNYDVRCDVAKLLGHLMASALNPPKHAISEFEKYFKKDRGIPNFPEVIALHL